MKTENQADIGAPLFYTAKALAALFSCSKDTIYRHVREHKFPKGKSAPGGMIWSRDVVEKFCASGQATDKEIALIRANAD